MLPCASHLLEVIFEEVDEVVERDSFSRESCDVDCPLLKNETSGIVELRKRLWRMATDSANDPILDGLSINLNDLEV